MENAPTPSRSRRYLRRVLWLGVILGILVVGGGTLYQHLDPHAPRNWLQTNLGQRLGRPVRIDSMVTDINGLTTIDGLSIDSASGAPFLMVKRLEAAVDLQALTSGNLLIQDLVLEEPVLRAASLEEGAAELKALAAGVKKTPGQTLKIDSVRVERGALEIGGKRALGLPSAVLLTGDEVILRGLAIEKEDGTRLTIERAPLLFDKDGWFVASVPAKVGDQSFSLSARIGDITGSPKLSGSAVAEEVDLGKEIMTRAPALQRFAIELKGRVERTFTQQGTSLTVVEKLTPQGGQLTLPTKDGPRRVTLEPGWTLDVQGPMITVKDLVIVDGEKRHPVSARLTVGAGSITVEEATITGPEGTLSALGSVVTGDPASFDLTLRGNYGAFGGEDLKELGLELPPTVRLKGPVTDPTIEGRFELAGLALKKLGLKTEMKVKSGALEVEAGKGKLVGVAIGKGDTHLEITGAIDKPGKDGRFQDVTIRGKIDPTDLSAKVEVTGIAVLEGTIVGPTKKPVLEGRVRSDNITFPLGGRRVNVFDVTGSVRNDSDGLDVTNVVGRALDGRLNGWVKLPDDGPSRQNFRLTGIDLVKFLEHEKLNLHATQGKIALGIDIRGGGKATQGTGVIWVEGVVIDGTTIPAVIQARRDLEKSQFRSGILTLLIGGATAGIGGALVGGVASRMLGPKEFVNTLNQAHPMGNVRIDFRFDANELILSPMNGDRLTGSLAIRRGDGAMNGKIESLHLGRVQLRNIGLAGTVAEPKTTFDVGDAKLVDEPPPLQRVPPPEGLTEPPAPSGEGILRDMKEGKPGSH